ERGWGEGRVLSLRQKLLSPTFCLDKHSASAPQSSFWQVAHHPSSNVVTPNNRPIGNLGNSPVYMSALSHAALMEWRSTRSHAARFTSGISRKIGTDAGTCARK